MDAELLGALVVSRLSADGQHARPNASLITARLSCDTARLPCLELVDLGGIVADAARHSSAGLPHVTSDSRPRTRANAISKPVLQVRGSER